VLGFLRALRKPAWLALLALPFVYNRAFFWGFASFNLALGVGLGVCALLAHERWSAARALGVAALASAIVFVHVYGIAFVLGYLALWLLLGERRAWLRRAPTAAIPTLLGGLGWAWSGRSAAGFSESFSPPFGRRMAGLPDALLGGYRDPSEAAILVALLATLALLCHRAVSTRCAALAALPHHERVLWLYIALNAVLYLVLPQHTLTAKFVHFRHAILAAVMLPLVVPRNALAAHPLLSRGALTALAAATIANAWIHLALFDREARSFEGVIAALPERSRVVALTWERNGSVVETIPYVHFAAYAQARKGGLLATTFPGSSNADLAGDAPPALRPPELRSLLRLRPGARRSPRPSAPGRRRPCLRAALRGPALAALQGPFWPWRRRRAAVTIAAQGRPGP
jgi:hypothetical protein